MKKLVLLLFVSTVAFAQKKSINNYKYIIVPKQFDFVKSPDKYRTSSLTKFLFKKHGFTAFLSHETLPKDVTKNRCLALTASVKDKSNMFTTKSIIELKDCNNVLVYSSQEGKSKLKEYKRAYHEAIRGAFKSIQNLRYKYVPLPEDVATNVVKEIVEVKQEKITLPPATTEVKNVVLKSSSDILYAQPKPNGYQLVNTKPEVVYELLNTNIKDTYILKNKNGILYKNNNSWIAEFYKNGSKIVKAVEVKF